MVILNITRNRHLNAKANTYTHKYTNENGTTNIKQHSQNVFKAVRALHSTYTLGLIVNSYCNFSLSISLAEDG